MEITSFAVTFGGRPAVLDSVLDVTYRRRTEAQTRYLDLLLATVNDAVVASDDKFILTGWNAAAESTYGRRAEEVLGQPDALVFRTDFVGVERAEAIQRLLDTGRFHGELTHRRADGRRIHIESRAAALFDSSGKRLGYVSVNRDITERRYAEETIRALLNDVLTAQEEERGRIARELHDDTAQTLTSLLVGLRAVEESQDLGQALGAASTLRGFVSAALLGVQRMARGLRPSVLDDLGLEEALERLALDVSRAQGFVVDLHSTGPRLPRLPEGARDRALPDGAGGADQRDQARLAQGGEHSHPSKPDRGAPGDRGRRKRFRRLGDSLRGAARFGGNARARPSRRRFDDAGILARKWHDHLYQRPHSGTEAELVMSIRVFLADDHGILRGGLRALINLQPDMEVVGEAANGPDAEIGVKTTEPDVVLMDISMPNGGGLAAIAAVKQVRPKTRIIVLTVHDELGYVRAAGQAGAVGYVVKSAVDTELLAAIRAVAQGRTFIDASLGLGFAQSQMQPTVHRHKRRNGDGAADRARAGGHAACRGGLHQLADRRRAAAGRQVGRDLPFQGHGKAGAGVSLRPGEVRPRLRRSRREHTTAMRRSSEDTMKRFRVFRWFDSALVFIALSGAFVWQSLTPEYRVLKPVRVRATPRSRRSR